MLSLSTRGAIVFAENLLHKGPRTVAIGIEGLWFERRLS